MSGHSRWHGVKHRKAAVDARRGKIFTKHAKLIEIAAREGGGGDPDTNTKLRQAIETAKAENVPNANIDRAIKKGIGELKGAAQTEEVLYEAFGPAGTAYLIECLTENRNRTSQSVKHLLHKNEGRLAQSGAVTWMFEHKGVVVVKVDQAGMRDELELQLIDAGAEDIDLSGSTLSVTTDRASWSPMRDVLKNAGLEILEAGLKYVPRQTVPIEDVATAQRILKFMSALEEDEDVSEVHTNAEIGEEIAQQLEQGGGA
jgi:YebC/PmpR family DNA-binding regulatory protein